MEKTALQQEIRRLLRERHAILLAHYYERAEVQETADILGDSLALSMEAAKTDAEVIVFAGVHFMAESAAILSPEKTVLLPRADAGCPLADMIAPADLARAKQEHPGAAVVTYINSSAAIKAQSDICCTSSNAVRIVNSLTDVGEVLMVPDGNLARYTARLTDRRIIPWPGHCPVHHDLTPEAVGRAKALHPEAAFAAHPECRAEVLEMADFVGSTAGIIRFAVASPRREIILGTETGVIAQIARIAPEKVVIPASDRLACRTMRLTTLEDIRDALVQTRHVITVPEAVAGPARRALERMLAVS
ncbi:MAG: quinolinate synthase NadA [Deltaproteobacteria bacterium]|nr:quinolinate synthase NadA [Deltaproteobacteria bacterium]